MSFTQFKFHPLVTANITACGYSTPTPIQIKAMPPILSGKDVIGLAQTGTGKTAAFVLPIVQRLLSAPKKSGQKTQAVIIAPTRELAEQIHESVIELTRGTPIRSGVVYGGVGKQPQLKALRSGSDIIVACPGRLLDLLSEKDIHLQDVKTLVLDEADHMFDQGFLPDIRRIIKQLPKKRQSLVFSATMPQAIKNLIKDIMIAPCTVQVDHTRPAETISHALINVTRAQKTPLLKSLLQREEMTSTVVFTRTKHKARSLGVQLSKAGIKAASIQGNLSQQGRRRAMEGFRDGTYKVLVATDIAARGIDVSGVSHVINFDMPDTRETYTHRTGRTGRAKETGEAITFAEADDKALVAQIEKALGKKMTVHPLETFVDVEELQKNTRRFANSPGPSAPRKSPKPGRRRNNRKRNSAAGPAPSRAAA